MGITLLFTELIYTCIWIVIRAVIRIRTRKIDFRREIMLLLMYVNLAVLISIVYFPMKKGIDAVFLLKLSDGNHLRVNLIPFVNLLDYDNRTDIYLNVIGNITMFIPTGVILPILYKKIDSFGKTVITGFLMSLVIELSQLPFAARATDIDDLILNTMGTAIGAMIIFFIRNKTVHK
jgi:glycopeptide antibiotics resistance protein